jgi:sugar-specific transcriptional regulator TrmB
MRREDVLQQFGLTEGEVKLYLRLLTFGEATASGLAKKTNTNRTFTYDRLKKLQDTGLVSYVVKDTKKYFKAADPNQLLAILKEKEEQISAILPELEGLRKVQGEGPDVKVFSSKKGVRTVLNTVLKRKGTVYVQGSFKKFEDVMQEFYTIWNSRRVKAKVRLKVLSNEIIDLSLAEVDILPENEKSTITTFTFGEVHIMILWSDVPVAIQIESKAIARDSLSLFNTIWGSEIKIYSGVDGIWKAFYDLVSKKTSTHLGIGYSFALAQVYGKGMSDDWHEKRLKNKIKSRLISYDDSGSKTYFKTRMKQWRDFNIRFLPKDICGPACMTLSDHMIATFIYTEGDFKVIVNKNKETITAYKKHFETLWKKAK